MDKETPMGVSQWKEYGKRHGYWQYFADEIKCKHEALYHERHSQLTGPTFITTWCADCGEEIKTVETK